MNVIIYFGIKDRKPILENHSASEVDVSHKGVLRLRTPDGIKSFPEFSSFIIEEEQHDSSNKQ